MKREVTYSFDRDDANPLSADHLDNVFHLLIGLATDEEKSQHAPHPGVKALRHIKGNHFTREHVEAFRTFVVELAGRAEERMSELAEERDRIAKDDQFSRNAYDGLIDSIRSNRILALRDLKHFLEEFREQVEKDIPGSVFSM